MDAETERRLQNIEVRFQRFDKFQRDVELSERERDARADERSKSMEKWMKSIDAALMERRNNDKWLLRILGTGVIAVFLNFVLSGGLTNGIS